MYTENTEYIYREEGFATPAYVQTSHTLPPLQTSMTEKCELIHALALLKLTLMHCLSGQYTQLFVRSIDLNMFQSF
jgi:hypothetical protein